MAQINMKPARVMRRAGASTYDAYLAERRGE